MDIKKLSTSTSLYKTLDYMLLTSDISLVHFVVKEDEQVIYDTYMFCHPNNIENILSPGRHSEPEAYHNLMFLHKSFLTDYETYRHPYNLEHFIDDYGKDRKALWEEIISGTLNIEDYLPVEISFYDNTIYPFTYGKERDGWFPHMVKFSQACYMITDEFYDLDKVKEFLLEQEKRGLVSICREDGMYAVDEEGIICKIPEYNRDEEESSYINFLCRVDDRTTWETIKSDVFGLRRNAFYTDCLKPFRKKEDLYL